jgi:hypothetical protein
MTTRFRRLSSTVLLTAVTAATVSAGGWVVITVQDLPDHAVVGQPLTLTYAVRQHGNKLTGGLTGRIEARSKDQLVEARAMATAEHGYYSATLTLPASGNWNIGIDSGFGGNFDSSRLVLPAIAGGDSRPTLPDADRGQRLFAAKGCAMCHAHPAIESEGVAAAPALGAKRYQAEFLKQFLAHPPKGKPDQFEMPDLGLRETEIASLVAFINVRRPILAAERRR